MNNNRKKYNQEVLAQIQASLGEQIDEMSFLSRKVREQLQQQEITSSGLSNYMEKGISALKSSNNVMKQLISNRSLFGCNSCILLLIATFTTFLLLLL